MLERAKEECNLSVHSEYLTDTILEKSWLSKRDKSYNNKEGDKNADKEGDKETKEVNNTSLSGIEYNTGTVTVKVDPFLLTPRSTAEKEPTIPPTPWSSRKKKMTWRTRKNKVRVRQKRPSKKNKIMFKIAMKSQLHIIMK